jgi:hypothetical protein
LSRKPRLFGKFHRAMIVCDGLGRLFIKLEFILHEWHGHMVNRACRPAATSRERGIKPTTLKLEPEFGQ